jgi:hypothetical protein
MAFAVHRPTFLQLMAAVFVLSCQLEAHPADIIKLRVKVEREQVELRFTFNLQVLSRFHPGIDANQDGWVDAEELQAAREGVGSYLNRRVQMQVNGGRSELGAIQAMEAMWPSVEGVIPAVRVEDYPARHLDILFVRQGIPLLADLRLGFDIWREAGPLGSVEAVYEQGELRTQVPFSMNEPDYLYDTGFAVEDVFKEPSPPVSSVAMTGRSRVTWKLCAGGALIAFFILFLLIHLFSRPKKP